MHVLVVTPAYPAPDQGTYMGIQRTAEGVVSGLREMGIEVTVATTYWGNDELPAETTTSEGVTVVRLSDSSNRFGKFGRLADLHFYTFSRSLKERTDLLEEADIVHSFMIAGAPKTDTPWISTHQHWGSSIDSLTDLLHTPFHTVFKNYSYSQIDALTTPSEFAKEQLEKELWIDPPPTEVVPHGVDIERFVPSEGEEAAPGEPVQLLYAGPFEERKRLGDFVKALGELDQRGIRFEAVFAGVGTTRSELEESIGRFGLSDYVRFPGYLEDEPLLEEYQNADLFIFPSVLEGFGQVLVEAMATHTPPIVCDKPPMNEIVPTQELVVEPCSPVALADRIESLVMTDAIPGLAKACRIHVEENYDWAAIAEQYRDLYVSLQ